MEDPELTPAQEEAVRRRLAAARHDQPMPADVASRMDDVIAGLAAERAGAPHATTPAATDASPGSSSSSGELATVTPLRRRWPQVLLAAAAVAAIGVGVTQVLPTDSGDDSSVDAGGSNSELDRDESFAEAPPESGGEEPPADAAPSEAPASGEDHYSAQLDRLAEDYLPQLSQLPGVTADKDSRAELRAQRAAGCGPATLPAGATPISVLYGGREALVVFGPVADPQLVSIYVCDSEQPRTPVETVELPAQP